MPATDVMSPVQAAEYAERLRAVVEDFDALGHGSRLAASLAIGVSSSRVTGVLKFRGVDEDLLGKLEEWAKDQRQARNL
jgi:hypothetical protein